MRFSFVLMLMLAFFGAGATWGEAQERAPATNQQTCPVDTVTDKSTGQPRKSGTGVTVCHDDHSGSVGVSVSGEELDHFLKYPIGKSDRSVAKQIGDAVHHFFHHL